MAIIEGVIRIALFLLYVWGISAMKDIRRLYQYHGAEHKCINCIEKGRPLTDAQCDAQLQTAQTLRHQLHFLCYAGKYCAVLLYPGG